MKFKCKPSNKPKIDDRRVITKFAFFPIKIRTECRWFETVTVLQEYRQKKWINLEFKDNKEK